MELVKNVFFNTDKLTPNINIKISYTGLFFQEGLESVSLHYGFGENWDNINDVEMKKTELGFQAEIQLLDSDMFNFCFKAENDRWDNNDGKNFSFAIEHPETALAVVPTKSNLLAVRKLRRSYLWKKKIRISIYKVLTYFPKLITGNYKKVTQKRNQN